MDNGTEFDSLAQTIKGRVENQAGEFHWEHARQIHKKFVMNRQQKREATSPELREPNRQHPGSSRSSDSDSSRLSSSSRQKKCRATAPELQEPKRKYLASHLPAKRRTSSPFSSSDSSCSSPSLPKESLGEVGECDTKMPGHNFRSGL